MWRTGRDSKICLNAWQDFKRSFIFGVYQNYAAYMENNDVFKRDIRNYETDVASAKTHFGQKGFTNLGKDFRHD